MTNTTDTQIFTAAGKALLAQLNAEEKPLVIDKMIFANVQNRPDFPQPDDVVPGDDVVHEAAVEQRGRLSVDSVIYSTTLTSKKGPFEFNWTGAYCSEYGVLVTIDYHALTPKTADKPGVAGNTLVRSIILEYKDVAEITNITVDAATWQYDSSLRMKKMDRDAAQAIVDQNGKDWFINDGFLVEPHSNVFNIKAGTGYVSGNRVELEYDRFIQVEDRPSFIYVDAYREGTPTGEQVIRFDFVVTDEEKSDYVNNQGSEHFVCKVAQVMGDGTVSDLRPEREVATRKWSRDNFVAKDRLQEEPGDAQENKVLVNGAHGLGGDAIFAAGDKFNLDASDTPTGYYTISTGHAGTYPPGQDGTDPAVLNVVRRYPGNVLFHTYKTKSGLMFERSFGSGTWLPWKPTSKSFGHIITCGFEVGRHVHIYKWGSRTGGNDWCFVRTPDNYNPNGKPHELVVLNHGNGWTMDGSESKANFSSNTQFGVDEQNGGTYLDTTRPDYVKYSNPLIEGLLAQGFVVCGAQNDNGMSSGSAAGWGARLVRQNVRDFVDHMRKNYNVTQYCHMIGASNGGLATLNAAMIMGRHNIRSVTLLYPVTNLYAAWKYSHRSSVEAAYGIASNSFADFAEKTEGHDPMSAFHMYTPKVALNKDELLYADISEYIAMPGDEPLAGWAYRRDLIGNYPNNAEPIVSGAEHDRVAFTRASMFPWPRIRCHYSMEDTVLDMNKHWLPFKQVLQNGGHVIHDELVTGNHGSWEHFDNVDGIVAWMNL